MSALIDRYWNSTPVEEIPGSGREAFPGRHPGAVGAPVCCGRWHGGGLVIGGIKIFTAVKDLSRERRFATFHVMHHMMG